MSIEKKAPTFTVLGKLQNLQENLQVIHGTMIVASEGSAICHWLNDLMTVLIESVTPTPPIAPLGTDDALAKIDRLAEEIRQQGVAIEIRVGGEGYAHYYDDKDKPHDPNAFNYNDYRGEEDNEVIDALEEELDGDYPDEPFQPRELREPSEDERMNAINDELLRDDRETEPNYWYWLDYMHAKGSSRMEFNSVVACHAHMMEKVHDPKDKHAYKITRQATFDDSGYPLQSETVVFDENYEGALVTWIDRMGSLILGGN